MSPARSETRDTHRARIKAAFARLRREGFVADGPLGPTRSDGWAEVHDRASDKQTPAVFWTEEADRAFSPSGMLKSRLALQWRGDARKIEAQLAAEGLKIEGALDDGDTILVLPARPGVLTKPPRL